MPNPAVLRGFQNVCARYQAALLAVSKTRQVEEIMELYQQGQRQFGENRAQEIAAKAPALPSDIAWHLIGHLQRNKVSTCLPYLSCIQSLDSQRLWEKINEEALLLDRKVDCLLQIKVAEEETKYGWDFHELISLLKTNAHVAWTQVNITGVMGMASLTDHSDQVRKEMQLLKKHFDELKTHIFSSKTDFSILSMGMSGDYQIALEEGSTMIRIGTKLFED